MLQMTNRSAATGNGKEDKNKESEKSDAKREGEVVLSGSMTRQVRTYRMVENEARHSDCTHVYSQTEQDWPLQDQASHITNTGRMIEEMEIKMRNLLQEVRLSVPDAIPIPYSFRPSHRCTSGRHAMSCSSSAASTTWRRPDDSGNCRRSSSASSNGDHHRRPETRMLGKRVGRYRSNCNRS